MLIEQGLRRSAHLYPDKVAAIDGDRRITYHQLAERVNRLANALIGLGLAPGDRVGMLMQNSFRYLELYHAVNVAGGVIVPLNYRLAAPELVFMLNDCTACILVVGREYVDVAAQMHAECPSITALVFAEDGEAPTGMDAYEDVLAAAGPAHPGVPVRETDLAGIFYTGGTTGLPKGVMLSHRNIVDNAWRVIVHLEYTMHDTFLHAAPMFHLADGSSIFAVTFVGGTHSHIRAFTPTAVLEAIARDHVTGTTIVPTMLNALVNHPAVASYNLSSLRFLTYCASPVSERLLRAAMDVFDCQFRQGYGLTETAPFLTVLSAPDHQLDGSEYARHRLRSAGQACIGVELRVVDDHDNELPTNTVGEIMARGDNIMMGYWNRPEETAAALRGGWFHTGDLATMDAGGYITIIDRKKDVIISGGENIYSVEVENALASHPSVLEVAVIGVPDDRWGEAVLAVVVARADQNPTGDELIAHCRGQIAGYKVPKGVAFADALPKSGAGKILKREIREQYWGGEERRVH